MFWHFHNKARAHPRTRFLKIPPCLATSGIVRLFGHRTIRVGPREEQGYYHGVKRDCLNVVQYALDGGHEVKQGGLAVHYLQLLCGKAAVNYLTNGPRISSNSVLHCAGGSPDPFVRDNLPSDTIRMA